MHGIWPVQRSASYNQLNIKEEKAWTATEARSLPKRPTAYPPFKKDYLHFQFLWIKLSNRIERAWEGTMEVGTARVRTKTWLAVVKIRQNPSNPAKSVKIRLNLSKSYGFQTVFSKRCFSDFSPRLTTEENPYRATENAWKHLCFLQILTTLWTHSEKYRLENTVCYSLVNPAKLGCTLLVPLIESERITWQLQYIMPCNNLMYSKKGVVYKPHTGRFINRTPGSL